MQIKITIPFYHHIKTKQGYKKVSIFHIMSKNVSHKLFTTNDKRTGKIVNRRIPKDDYIRLLKEICVLIQAKNPQFNVHGKPRANEIVISYTAYKPTHNGDTFNLLDGLADAVKTVIGIDDRYFACDGIYSVIDKKNPRIELTIKQEDK